MHFGKTEIWGGGGDTDPTGEPPHLSTRASPPLIHPRCAPGARPSQSTLSGGNLSTVCLSPGWEQSPALPSLISVQTHVLLLPALRVTPEKADFRRAGHGSQERKCSLQTPAATGKKNIYIYLKKNQWLDFESPSQRLTSSPEHRSPHCLAAFSAGSLPTPGALAVGEPGLPRGRIPAAWTAPAHACSTELLLAQGSSIYPM